ncbi:hypothetical protein NQ317_017260 [Molorchus minor]|uniref:Uncharacterized protein n=1 Tax=Molorchus minor TaxID=1323400 RepID=A0ABQ9JSB2_9CUCU|nr:hypothetical protein NQ317_017260 [Molorchus minor]
MLKLRKSLIRGIGRENWMKLPTGCYRIVATIILIQDKKINS